MPESLCSCECAIVYSVVHGKFFEVVNIFWIFVYCMLCLCHIWWNSTPQNHSKICSSIIIMILDEETKLTVLHVNSVYSVSVQVPVSWMSEWEGPGEPALYLRSLVGKALALGVWEERGREGRLLQDTLDLSELFHPDTFLNALRQQTARFVIL